jgi:hypothetical protein
MKSASRLRIPVLAARLAAAALLGSLPLAAAAQETPSNAIVIDGYAAEAAVYGDTASYPSMLTLAFHNAANVDATDVKFAVEGDRHGAIEIDDVGRFSPGVTIRRRFIGLDVAGGDSMRVTEVRYADGSTWMDDDRRALRELQRRQAAEPQPESALSAKVPAGPVQTLPFSEL